MTHWSAEKQESRTNSKMRRHIKFEAQGDGWDRGIDGTGAARVEQRLHEETDSY